MVAVGGMEAGEIVPVQAAFWGQQATLLSGSREQTDCDGQQREGAPSEEHEFPDEAQFPARGIRGGWRALARWGARKGKSWADESGRRVRRNARRKGLAGPIVAVKRGMYRCLWLQPLLAHGKR